MNVLPHDVRLVCTNCTKQLATVRSHRFFPDNELEVLEHARRALVVNFPVAMDDGSVRVVEGYRVQYNNALGPTKGGIRIHERADFDDVSELAFLMTLKTSLAGLPYGGAKGAIRIDPKTLSPKEHERVVRGFIREIAHFIGPDRDIPAPDVNTTPETMALMLDEYEKTVGHTSPAAFTGKPFALGGSLGRDSSTSKGGFYIIQEYFKNTNPEEISVAIQGFGNVGAHLAELLAEAGFKIVAVSDSGGGIYNESGLPMEDVIRFKRDGGRFADYADNPKTVGILKTQTRAIGNKELLALDVELLIPAALGGVITPENAADIRAGVIIEMANAPVAPEVDPMLKEKHIPVIPDILANSGGVIVSYFEWLQNRTDEQWTLEKVNEKLKKMILTAYRNIWDECERRPQLDMRTISYLLAIKRILEAEKTTSK
jgi:glutamate dehydrogenase/leucine dehydrogenase